MPGIDNEDLKPIQQRLAQQKAVQVAQDSSKPIVRKYINPADPKAIISAAKKRDCRTRAQRPSTPPMPNLALNSVEEGSAKISPSNSFYVRSEHELSLSPPLFFPLAAQSRPQVSPPQQWHRTAKDGADTSARYTQKQPLAQGPNVNVLRTLRKMRASTVLDTLDELKEESQAKNAEIADIINACAAHNNTLESTTNSIRETLLERGHFAGAVSRSLRRGYPKPPALNLTAINTHDTYRDTPEPVAPRAPRGNMSFLFSAEAQERQAQKPAHCSVSDISQELKMQTFTTICGK